MAERFYDGNIQLPDGSTIHETLMKDNVEKLEAKVEELEAKVEELEKEKSKLEIATKGKGIDDSDDNLAKDGLMMARIRGYEDDGVEITEWEVFEDDLDHNSKNIVELSIKLEAKDDIEIKGKSTDIGSGKIKDIDSSDDNLMKEGPKALMEVMMKAKDEVEEEERRRLERREIKDKGKSTTIGSGKSTDIVSGKSQDIEKDKEWILHMLTLLVKDEAQDLLEYDVVHNSHHVTAMLKIKKKKKSPLALDDSGKSKDIGSAKSTDIGSGKSKDIGSGKNLFILIAGLPGAGKSSSLSKAMNHFKDGVYEEEPIKHVRFIYKGKSFVHMGSLRAQYPGSDSLPRSHQPIKDFLESMVGKPHVVVSEGQRLTSSHFLEDIASWYDIIAILIKVDTDTAASRVHLRDGKNKEYKPAFLKQVMGAIRNIKSSMPHNAQLVDGTQSADTVAAAIKSIVTDRL